MKRLWLTIAALLLAAGPASAQFNTRGTQSYRNALTANNEFGSPRFTTTLLPTCSANNLGAMAWDTTTSGFKVCNGSTWAAVGGAAAIDACPQTDAHSICKGDSTLVFEGASANDHETTLTVTDPFADTTFTIGPSPDGNPWIGATAGDSAAAADVDNVFLGQGAGTAANGTSTDNVCIGDFACDSLDTGDNNISIGSGSDAGTTGSYNTCVGAASCPNALATDGSVALGFGADVIAASSIAIGRASFAGGEGSISIGYQAGASQGPSEVDNVFVGYQAGTAATGTSTDHVFVGDGAGAAVTTGDNNVLIGSGAGDLATDSEKLVCIGTDACNILTTGANNGVFIGYNADATSTGDDLSVAIGGETVASEGAVAVGGQAKSYGQSVVIGTSAGLATGSGDADNVFVGYNAAVLANGTSINNTCVGDLACATLTTGDGVVNLGADSDVAVATDSNGIAIGLGAISGGDGISIGAAAGDAQGSGDVDNVFIGSSAGSAANGTSTDNTCIGDNACDTLTTGDGNTIVGADADQVATQGNSTVVGFNAQARHASCVAVGGISGCNLDSVSVGYAAGSVSSSGDAYDVYVGKSSGTASTGGATNNTCVGYQSCNLTTTGDRVVAIGGDADVGTNTDSDVTIIGESMTGKGSDSILLGFGGQEYMYVHGAGKVVTDASATAMADFSVADDTAGGATIEYTVTVAHNDEYQAERGSVYIAWENDSGTESCSIGEIGTSVLAGGGTLAITNACTVGLTDEVRWTFTADSDLGAPATTVTVYWSVRIDGPATTVSPQ